MYIHTEIYIYIYIGVNLRVCGCLRVCVYVYIYQPTHTHSHVYTSVCCTPFKGNTHIVDQGTHRRVWGRTRVYVLAKVCARAYKSTHSNTRAHALVCVLPVKEGSRRRRLRCTLVLGLPRSKCIMPFFFCTASPM